MRVIDDFSRFILAWALKTDMAAGSLTDVVQPAVDLTGMTDVPVEGHYRQEGTIIGPSGSRPLAFNVSINSQGQIVPLSLTAYTFPLPWPSC